MSSPNLPRLFVEENPKLRLKRNIREARLLIGKTVVEAAAAVGKSRQAVTAWERFDLASPVPDDRELKILADLYETTPDLLKSGRNPAVPATSLDADFQIYLMDAGYEFTVDPALIVDGQPIHIDLLVRHPRSLETTIVELKPNWNAKHASVSDQVQYLASKLGARAIAVTNASEEFLRTEFPPVKKDIGWGDHVAAGALAGFANANRHRAMVRESGQRGLSQAIREFLAQSQLELVRSGAKEEEVSEALQLLRSPEVFSFYEGGAPKDFNDEQILMGMRAIYNGVIKPELESRGYRFFL